MSDFQGLINTLAAQDAAASVHVGGGGAPPAPPMGPSAVNPLPMQHIPPRMYAYAPQQTWPPYIILIAVMVVLALAYYFLVFKKDTDRTARRVSFDDDVRVRTIPSRYEEDNHDDQNDRDDRNDARTVGVGTSAMKPALRTPRPSSDQARAQGMYRYLLSQGMAPADAQAHVRAAVARAHAPPSTTQPQPPHVDEDEEEYDNSWRQQQSQRIGHMQNERAAMVPDTQTFVVPSGPSGPSGPSAQTDGSSLFTPL